MAQTLFHLKSRPSDINLWYYTTYSTDQIYLHVPSRPHPQSSGALSRWRLRPKSAPSRQPMSQIWPWSRPMTISAKASLIPRWHEHRHTLRTRPAHPSMSIASAHRRHSSKELGAIFLPDSSELWAVEIQLIETAVSNRELAKIIVIDNLTANKNGAPSPTDRKAKSPTPQSTPKPSNSWSPNKGKTKTAISHALHKEVVTV